MWNCLSEVKKTKDDYSELESPEGVRYSERLVLKNNKFKSQNLVVKVNHIFHS